MGGAEGTSGTGGWERIGWISVDGGTAAFGDAAEFPADRPVPKAAGVPQGTVDDLTVAGVPMIPCSTGGDLDLPVEVVRNDRGEIVRARLWFTDDVDEFDAAHKGSWQQVAALPLVSGSCFAADPTCLPGEAYRVDFEVVPGQWSVEVFTADDDDCLGLRISR